MAIYRCKTCGAQLNVTSENKIIECDYCGTTQTLPKTMDENTISLFNRATTLLQKAEYDKAESIYEKILTIDSEEPEAYWGLILCKYGIEYVEDPKTFKKIPTCHRSSYDSVIADEDYKNAIKYADISQKILYEEEAKVIDEIQKGILEVASKEEPYDIFISYKETDENGRRTADSGIANDIYYQLTNEGYKVFYSAISLEDKLGKDYEPIIFSALHSSKVMLVIGTKPEYINAPWVKNEWSRFLKIMKNDRTRLLIPCYKNMDPYELPNEFAHLQAQDMGKIGFVNDLVRGIKKVITKEETVEQNIHYVNNTNNQTINQLLKRVFIFLEDQKFEEADEYCEKVLDIDAENGQAYLGKLLSEFRIKKIEDIEYINYYKLKKNINLPKIYKYCDQKTIEQIKSIIDKTSKLLYFSQKDIDSGDLEMCLSNEVVPAITFDSSVKEIKKSYFEKAYKFRKIIIPSSVSKIEDRALGSIYIEDILVESNNRYYSSIDGNLYSIGATTLIQYANGKQSESFVIPSSVTYIGLYDAFYCCGSLKNITISSSVKSIEDSTFRNCTSLENIVVDEKNEYYKSIDGNLYTKDGKTLVQYAIAKKDTSFTIPFGVTQIENSAFYSCKYLKSIVVPKSVTDIGKWAFNSYVLRSITIPRSVKKIDNQAFFGIEKSKYYININLDIDLDSSIVFQQFSDRKFIFCEQCDVNSIVVVDDFVYNIINNNEVKLINYIGTYKYKIDIPEKIEFNNSYYLVTCIGHLTFALCPSLKTITIPSNVTSIEKFAFYKCPSLENIIISSSVTCIETSAFSECTNLEVVKFEEGSKLTSIENKAFCNCTSLQSITIPSSVTSIEVYAFFNCTNLETVKFEEGSKLTSIGNKAFYKCTSLQSIEIPSSVTSIGYNAFYKCTSLESVTISSNVETIGNYAFEECSKLTIYCEMKKRPKTWKKSWNSFEESPTSFINFFKSIPVVWNYKKQNKKSR